MDRSRLEAAERDHAQDRDRGDKQSGGARHGPVCLSRRGPEEHLPVIREDRLRRRPTYLKGRGRERTTPGRGEPLALRGRRRLVLAAEPALREESGAEEPLGKLARSLRGRRASTAMGAAGLPRGSGSGGRGSCGSGSPSWSRRAMLEKKSGRDLGLEGVHRLGLAREDGHGFGRLDERQAVGSALPAAYAGARAREPQEVGLDALHAAGTVETREIKNRDRRASSPPALFPVRGRSPRASALARIRSHGVRASRAGGHLRCVAFHHRRRRPRREGALVRSRP